MTKPVFIEVNEKSRTYVFKGGGTLTIKNVLSINVSKSGTHRINTITEEKYIVPPYWLYIKFEADDWTF